MNKIIKIPFNAVLGIMLEVLYALSIMLIALLICALVSPYPFR